MQQYKCSSMQDYFKTVVLLVKENEKSEFKPFSDQKALRYGLVNFDLDAIITFQLSKFSYYYDKPMFFATREQRELATVNYKADLELALTGVIPEDRKKDVVGSRWETTEEKIGDAECVVSRRVDIKATDN